MKKLANKVKMFFNELDNKVCWVIINDLRS